MTLFPIITIPDPILRQISTPVERIDEALTKLAEKMLATMYEAPGIGLAAVQVGIPRRMFVVDVADDEEGPQPLVMINPEILATGSALRMHEEGCLSIPDVLVEIERPSTCTIRYLDRAGKQQTLEAEGLLATAVQHELDHLDGRMIIDYMSRLKRDMVIRKFKKIAREAGA